MSRGRAPNYIITEEHTYSLGVSDYRTLPAGTFVRPLELHYVPKHIIEDKAHLDFNKVTQIYCYCRFGIVAIPRKIIKESV